MEFTDLERIVNDHIDLVEINAAAIVQSKERSAKFLVIQAILSSHLKILQDVKVKAATEESACYAQALLSASGKNVTENKIIAEASPVYSAARERKELIDSEINWVKQHFDIFNNAHIMFRQYSKE
jgi:hypothetical protein